MVGPLPYLGTKRRLARQLIDLFPEHTTYVEPFCGGAKVFFEKEPSRVEVLNDLDGELVNFLRVCQLHHEEMLRWLQFAVTSREMFNAYQQQDPRLLTDVQRAARFLYLQKTTWGGKVRGQTFNYRAAGPGRFILSQVRRLVEEAAKRLERVQLENWPYEKVLERYDRPTTLFYCDPPYIGRRYYHSNFADADFEQLAERLAALQGKFLLSINDHPLARKAFGRFRCQRLRVRYSLVRDERNAQELVFSNS